MKMKKPQLIAILVVLAGSLFISQSVFAQSSQNSYTIDLTYLTVQLSYPSQVLPGDSVTVNLQATAKSSVSSVTVTAQIDYANGADLHQLASATVSNNYMTRGNSLSKQFQFAIPQDAPRTSLIAILAEKVRTVYTSYYYYPVSYNYSSPYCYYYPYWGDDCYYNSAYYSYWYYPSYSYSTTTDSGIAPLSYIKATTPEYTALQSQYQSLQQQLAQSQAQNQQLNQNLQNAQNTIAQRDATIAHLNQQLNSSQTTNTTLEAIAVGLAIVAIVLGLVAAHEHRGRNELKQETKAEA
jgi:hypothetical protein